MGQSPQLPVFARHHDDRDNVTSGIGGVLHGGHYLGDVRVAEIPGNVCDAVGPAAAQALRSVIGHAVERCRGGEHPFPCGNG
jgi:hypothetical protein